MDGVRKKGAEHLPPQWSHRSPSEPSLKHTHSTKLSPEKGCRDSITELPVCLRRRKSAAELDLGGSVALGFGSDARLYVFNSFLLLHAPAPNYVLAKVTSLARENGTIYLFLNWPSDIMGRDEQEFRYSPRPHPEASMPLNKDGQGQCSVPPWVGHSR